MPWLTLALLLQDPQYDSRFLSVGTTVDKILVKDLDADGDDDLLVQSGRDLRLFLSDPKDGLRSSPSQTLRFESGVFLWTLGHVRDRKLWSVVVATSRGIHYYPFQDGALAPKPRDLVIHPNLFEGEPLESPPVCVEFAPDLDRDGLSDFLLFDEGEMMVLLQQEDGSVRATAKLPLPDEARMTLGWSPTMRHKEERVIPLLTFDDATGDGKPDLSFYREESIVIYSQKDDGRFETRAPADLTTEKEKTRGRFFRFELPPVLMDFNRDGVLDIALPYPTKGRVHVFYLTAGRANFTQPDDVLQVGDSWTAGLFATDLDGGGKPDIVIGIVRKFGVFGGLQAFVSGKIDLELHVHYMRERFQNDPDQVLTFRIPYSFAITRSEATIDLAFRPSFDADVDGDGHRDLLLSTDAETIDVYYGRQGQGFQQSPGGRIQLGGPKGISYTQVMAADLNRDKRSDLILRHIHVDQQRHFLQVKISRK